VSLVKRWISIEPSLLAVMLNPTAVAVLSAFFEISPLPIGKSKSAPEYALMSMPL